MKRSGEDNNSNSSSRREWKRRAGGRMRRGEMDAPAPALCAVEDDLERTFEVRRGEAGPTEPSNRLTTDMALGS